MENRAGEPTRKPAFCRRAGESTRKPAFCRRAGESTRKPDAFENFGFLLTYWEPGCCLESFESDSLDELACCQHELPLFHNYCDTCKVMYILYTPMCVYSGSAARFPFLIIS